MKNPFESLEITIRKKLEFEFKEDYEKLKGSDNLLYHVFKNADEISIHAFQSILLEINALV